MVEFARTLNMVLDSRVLAETDFVGGEGVDVAFAEDMRPGLRGARLTPGRGPFRFPFGLGGGGANRLGPGGAGARIGAWFGESCGLGGRTP